MRSGHLFNVEGHVVAAHVVARDVLHVAVLAEVAEIATARAVPNPVRAEAIRLRPRQFTGAVDSSLVN